MREATLNKDYVRCADPILDHMAWSVPVLFDQGLHDTSGGGAAGKRPIVLRFFPSSSWKFLGLPP